MHLAAFRFVQRAAAAIPTADQHILELGSYDVNATEQGLDLRTRLFAGAAAYVGLDVRPGPGVDVVADPATYTPEQLYDLVVCCEVLEHTADPGAVIQAAQRLLRPGGLLILTAASPERPPHNCDGNPWAGVEPYTPIAVADLQTWLAGWTAVAVEHDPAAGDVYALAYTPIPNPADPAVEPTAEETAPTP